MSKPPKRADLPQRDDARRKRWLEPNPRGAAFLDRFVGIRYGCSGKHKSNPYHYDVAPYHGKDSDRSLCDAHTGFTKPDLARVPFLFGRAKQAGLAGNLIWTVDDTGWIYELQVTNAGQNEWHGYPVLPSDPFAQQIWDRFSDWALQHGSAGDQDAAKACALLYGLRK